MTDMGTSMGTLVVEALCLKVSSIAMTDSTPIETGYAVEGFLREDTIVLAIANLMITLQV